MTGLKCALEVVAKCEIAAQHVSVLGLLEKGLIARPQRRSGRYVCVTVIRHGCVDGREDIRLPTNPLGNLAPSGGRNVGCEVDADQRRDTVGMPTRGGETDPSAERMTHQHRRLQPR